MGRYILVEKMEGAKKQSCTNLLNESYIEPEIDKYVPNKLKNKITYSNVELDYNNATNRNMTFYSIDFEDGTEIRANGVNELRRKIREYANGKVKNESANYTDALSYNNKINKKYKNRKNTYLIAPNPGNPEAMARFNSSVGDATGMGTSASGGCGESLQESFDWEEIPEMQDDDGTPNGFAKRNEAILGNYIWLTKFEDGWHIEVCPVDDFISLKLKNGSPRTFATEKAAMRWVDNHENEILRKYGVEDDDMDEGLNHYKMHGILSEDTDYQTVENTYNRMTNGFTQKSGTLDFDNKHDAEMATHIFHKHYKNVDLMGTGYVVSFERPIESRR